MVVYMDFRLKNGYALMYVPARFIFNRYHWQELAVDSDQALEWLLQFQHTTFVSTCGYSSVASS